MLSFDECGPLLRIVWRDPTVLNDWHTAADLSDEMTHIVSVGVRTGETPDTIFLTREVCADGELRGTNAIPKPLIVHQDRLHALTEGEPKSCDDPHCYCPADSCIHRTEGEQ